KVVVDVPEPGGIVAGCRLALEQTVRAGQDDVLPRWDVTPRTGDQVIVAIDVHRVDPAIAPGPGLMDRVGLRRPVVEVPRLLEALADLHEVGAHRVSLLGTLHPKGIPPLMVPPDLLAVDLGRDLG